MTKKVENKEFEARKPDYKADGIAVWINKENGKDYVTVKITGHNTITAFPIKEE